MLEFSMNLPDITYIVDFSRCKNPRTEEWCNAPAVPRKGDTIKVDDTKTAYEVVEVEWLSQYPLGADVAKVGIGVYVVEKEA